MTCEVLDCDKPAEVAVASDRGVTFNFCSECAEERTEMYQDLELCSEGDD